MRNFITRTRCAPQLALACALWAFPSITAAQTLQWDANPVNDAIQIYQVEVKAYQSGTCPNFVEGDALQNVPNNTTQYVLPDFAVGSQHCARVYAVNVNGRSGPSNTVGFTTLDTLPPSVPVSVTAIPVSATQVNLMWPSATDNVGVTKYLIFRGAMALGQSTTTSFSDTTVIANSAYSYSVAAVDAAGNISGQSSAVMVETPSPPTTPCTNNGKPYTIGIAVQSYTKQLSIGTRGAVVFTLANSFSVTQVQIKLGTQVAGEINGVELRDVTGIAFSVPRAAGTYNLFVVAKDAQGCVTSTTAARPMVVQ